MMNMVYAIREKGTSFFLMVVLALSLAWVPDGVFAQNVDVSEIAALGLPVVVIETAGHEEPKCEFVPAPPGCNGDAIVNATKVPGEGYIVMGGSILWQSGKYLGGVSGLTIRIWGNSSAYADKKPYKLKLQREADLVDGNPQYADKEWLLIKNDTISLSRISQIFFRTRITRIARKRRGCEPFSLSLAATAAPRERSKMPRRGMMAVASHAVTRGLFVSLFRAPAYAALRAAG